MRGGYAYDGGIRRRIAAVALIALLAVGLVACEDGAFKKAARVSSAAAESVGALQKINEEAYGAGILTAEEALAFTDRLDHANEAVRVFNAKARQLKDLDPGNKALLALWYSDLVREIDQLNTEGILQIKNEQLRSKMSVVFAGIQAALQVGAEILREADNG